MLVPEADNLVYILVLTCCNWQIVIFSLMQYRLVLNLK